MIKLQFKDFHGHITKATFDGNSGAVHVDSQHTLATYTKDSPIATMYQSMLHNSRKAKPNLYQVIGAW